MSSNFERLQNITNQAYAENCQDPPICGQDDLVELSIKIFGHFFCQIFYGVLSVVVS